MTQQPAILQGELHNCAINLFLKDNPGKPPSAWYKLAFHKQQAYLQAASNIVREELSIPQADRESMPTVWGGDDSFVSEARYKLLNHACAKNRIYEAALRFYAKHIHWMGSSDALQTCLVAMQGDGEQHGWRVAEDALLEAKAALAQADKTAGLADRVRALEEALRFYADEIRYARVHQLADCYGSYAASDVMLDKGKRARQALGDTHE